MNDSFREPVNDEPSAEHVEWCAGGTARVVNSMTRRRSGSCDCDASCCTRLRGNGHVECICERCDGTCGAHLDDGGALATFLFCLAVAFVLGFAVLRGAM